MPICITGMHRSGTSMVARILRVCGVYLGAESDFAPPAPDNPTGYWEDLRFVRLNDAILGVLGGAWDLPPVREPGWGTGPALAPFRADARALLAGEAAREPWGFKDPRASLLSPFWLELSPALRLVVCVRHPFEVARSLQARGYTSLRFGLRLWTEYYSALADSAGLDKALVTHYDSYFADPKQEVARLLDFLGVVVPAEVLDAAAGAAAGGQRHHRGHGADLEALGMPLAGQKLYADLCARCSPLPERSAAALPPEVATQAPPRATESARTPSDVLEGCREQIVVLTAILAARDAELGSVKFVLSKHDEELLSVRSVLLARDLELGSLRPLLASREEQLRSILPVLASRDAELASLRTFLADRERELQSLRAELSVRDAELKALRPVIGERDRELRSLRALLEAREAELALMAPTLAARDEELASLRPVLGARDTELASIKAVLQARDEELASVRFVLNARDGELLALKPLLAAREAELAALRATRPA